MSKADNPSPLPGSIVLTIIIVKEILPPESAFLPPKTVYRAGLMKGRELCGQVEGGLSPRSRSATA
jgi:hypothetical protein